LFLHEWNADKATLKSGFLRFQSDNHTDSLKLNSWKHCSWPAALHEGHCTACNETI